MLGENIRRIRESKNIGVNELARIANMNASYLSSIETGVKTNPSYDVLDKIAIALEVPVNKLMDSNYSFPSSSNGIGIDDCILFYEYSLNMGNVDEVMAIYEETLSWLKEIRELSEFKSRVLNAVRGETNDKDE